MGQQRIVRAAVAAGLVLALGACAAEESADVVAFGYSGPLSGGAALYGRNAQNGLQMAVDEINEAGGIQVEDRQVRIELVSLDDRYLPNETATNARRLLQQNRTPVIWVSHAGGILALQGMNTREPRFLLMAYSSEPSILDAGNPLTVMIPPRYDGYAPVFVQTTMGRFGTRLALLGTTTTYGRAWTEVVSAEWRRQGGEVLGDHGIDYNTTTDFTAAVSRALADDPDVLFVGGPSQPTALVVRAAREQGFQGGFLMMDQPKMEEMVQVIPMEMLEGAVGVHPQETYPGPGVAQFVERYYARFGPDARPAVSEMALNYQALHTVAKAMSLAGTTTDAEAIRAHMDEAARLAPESARLLDFSGVADNGYIARQVFAAHVVDGEFVAFPVPPPPVP
jgi:branched-chain amino acid transport system substrate-binding protein